MRRRYVALTGGVSLLLLTGFGVAVWAIAASIRHAAQRGFTLYYGPDQAARDAIPPVLAGTMVALPLVWLVGTMALLAAAQRGEVSARLLLIVVGQFLCLFTWVLPLALPYGVGMGAWVLWSAIGRPLGGRVYRAVLGALLTLSGVLYALELLAGQLLWLALACYAILLVIYCSLVLVRPAMLYQH